MFDPLTLFYLASAIILLGIAKGGFGGVGAPVALPIMSLGVSPELALGAMLPILMAMDVVSVSAHKKSADISTIRFALPGAVLGVLVGAAIIAYVSPRFVGGSIGVLAVLFALLALSGREFSSKYWPQWVGSIFGGLCGLTSTLAHAGGPPIHMYLLSKSYEPVRFVATSAVFMAGVNLIKLVPFILIGALDKEALTLSLILAPLAVIAAFFGVFIAHILSKKLFKYIVNGLLMIAGFKLILDALF